MRKYVQAQNISNTELICVAPSSNEEEELVSIQLVIMDTSSEVIFGSNFKNFYYIDRTMKLNEITPKIGDANTGTLVVITFDELQNVTSLECKFGNQITSAMVIYFTWIFLLFF